MPAIPGCQALCQLKGCQVVPACFRPWAVRLLKAPAGPLAEGPGRAQLRLLKALGRSACAKAPRPPRPVRLLVGPWAFCLLLGPPPRRPVCQLAPRRGARSAALGPKRESSVLGPHGALEGPRTSPCPLRPLVGPGRGGRGLALRAAPGPPKACGVGRGSHAYVRPSHARPTPVPARNAQADGSHACGPTPLAAGNRELSLRAEHPMLVGRAVCPLAEAWALCLLVGRDVGAGREPLPSWAGAPAAQLADVCLL